jgi:hypothetical protein
VPLAVRSSSALISYSIVDWKGSESAFRSLPVALGAGLSDVLIAGLPSAG